MMYGRFCLSVSLKLTGSRNSLLAVLKQILMYLRRYVCFACLFSYLLVLSISLIARVRQVSF